MKVSSEVYPLGPDALTYNANIQRRPEKGVRWRPFRAGTHWNDWLYLVIIHSLKYLMGKFSGLLFIQRDRERLVGKQALGNDL